MTTRWLITGASGFCGRHLIELLGRESGASIHACCRRPAAVSGVPVAWQACDITDKKQVEAVVSAVRPDAVIHLAGLGGGADAEALEAVNVGGTRHLLDACGSLGAAAPRVLLVGSAAGFGEMLDHETALGPERPPAPISDHGRSREAALALGRKAAAAGVLDVRLCRPFNVIGPGTPLSSAPAAIAARLRAAAAAGATGMPLRDGAAVRDFIDVRDVAAALVAIVRRGRPAVPYSIGSGTGTTIRELAGLMAQQLGCGHLPVIDEPAGASIRRSVADPRPLVEDTGWRPQVPLVESIAGTIAASAPGTPSARDLSTSSPS